MSRQAWVGQTTPPAITIDCDQMVGEQRELLTVDLIPVPFSYPSLVILGVNSLSLGRMSIDCDKISRIASSNKYIGCQRIQSSDANCLSRRVVELPPLRLQENACSSVAYCVRVA